MAENEKETLEEYDILLARRVLDGEISFEQAFDLRAEWQRDHSRLYCIQIEIMTDAPAELVHAEAEQAVKLIHGNLKDFHYVEKKENIDFVVMWTENDEHKKLRG